MGRKSATAPERSAAALRTRRLPSRSMDGEARARRLVSETVERLRLDLAGLTVYTEAASGPYLWTPLLAAAAGARVIAVAADSEHHAAARVERETLALARRWRLERRLRIVGA